MRILYLFLLFTILVHEASGQGFCQNKNLTPGQKIICGNIEMWDEKTSAIEVPTTNDMLPQVQGSAPYVLGAALSAAPIPSTKYECMDWQCVCGYLDKARWDGWYCTLPGGGYLSNQQRKEYRTLSRTEISLYTEAFLAAKNDIYGYISTIHSDYLQSPGAHSGPAFLPWHRELLKRMEIGIRTARVNGKYPYWRVTIPYWDSSMDADILNFLGISPTNSIMFSDDLMGSTVSGFLTDGQFAGFSGRQGKTRRVLDQWPRETFLIQRREIEDLIKNHGYNDILGATAGPNRDRRTCAAVKDTNIELLHGSPHVWIGGNMEKTVTATNDPIFFCHHAFIDAIWEEWRLKKQNPTQRETQWNTGSTKCYSQSHLKDALMVPFSGGYVNIDGLSNKYTRNFYTYSPRLKCSATTDCPGEFLWCHIPTGTCAAKIKSGSKCKIIRGVDPCHSATCTSGICRPLLGGPQGSLPVPVIVPTVEKDLYETCFNQHECCSTWDSQRLCSTNAAVKVACPASCGMCKTKKALTDNCMDRHPLCDTYAKDGQCDKNPFFMAENCRKTCNKCGKTRAQSCQSKDSGYVMQQDSQSQPLASSQPEPLASSPNEPLEPVPLASSPVEPLASSPDEPLEPVPLASAPTEPLESSPPLASSPGETLEESSLPLASPPEPPANSPDLPQASPELPLASSVESLATSPAKRPASSRALKLVSGPRKKITRVQQAKKRVSSRKPQKADGCYNSNLCCEHWKATVGCTKMGVLTHACAASCLCKPKYDLMSCNDFLENCGAIKKSGLCHLDQMKENCRTTCRSCPTSSYLAKHCGSGH